jgi:gamma-glutamylcyclotransferase (GGCT)/AIG2-like uncharacterized protein YtfP
MSCRSTPLSSAMVSFANALHPDLSDSQIQSLFHALKREQKAGATEYIESSTYIEKLKSQVRNSDITDRQKESILQRVSQSEGIQQEQDMLYASTKIVEAAGVAEYQISRIAEAVALDFNIDPYLVRKKVNRWRDASEDSYEDMGEEIPKAYRYDLVPGVPTDDRTGRALRKLGYTQFLGQPYPVFVYGTLRQGQGNSALFGRDYYQIAPAAVAGVGVYGAQRSFPYAKENSNAAAFGDIFWIDETEAGAEVRSSLDSLEGFDSDYPSHSHYKRVLREASYVDYDGKQKTTPVWMYLASGRYSAQLREEELISDGDWVTARNKYRDSPLGRQERRHLGY